MRQRFCSELKKFSFILLVGIGYYAFVTIFGFGLPCLFHEVTGLLCPGCGVSRMLIAISRFEFQSAFMYNKALFILLPVILAIYANYEVVYIRTGQKSMGRVGKCLLIGTAVLLIAFGIVRNII